MARTPSDTHPAAAQKQIELIRQTTPAQRFARCRSLSQTVISLSRRAIRRANPQFSEADEKIRFIELHYGTDLAKQFRKHCTTDA